MAMNQIQFQPGLSLPEFMQHYGSEEQCQHALEQRVWPQGFRCPRCGHDQSTVLERRGQRLHQCRVCRHQA